jgi:hypothetical protein
MRVLHRVISRLEDDGELMFFTLLFGMIDGEKL